MYEIAYSLSTSTPKYAPIVVLLVHEALQGREATVEDELKITDLTLSKGKGREFLGFSSELIVAGEISGEEVLEDTTMRRVRHDE